MYHMFKDDPWGNKIHFMSISSRKAADAFLRRNEHIITRIVEVPRSVSTLIKM